MAKYVVDAHALVWRLTGSPRLSARAKSIFDDPSNEFILPIIALAEIFWMIERKKTTIPDHQQLMAEIDSNPRIIIVPLDRETLVRCSAMTAVPEMHDRMIVVTAQIHSLPIITKDRVIHASGLVPVVW